MRYDNVHVFIGSAMMVFRWRCCDGGSDVDAAVATSDDYADRCHRFLCMIINKSVQVSMPRMTLPFCQWFANKAPMWARTRISREVGG